MNKTYAALAFLCVAGFLGACRSREEKQAEAAQAMLAAAKEQAALAEAQLAKAEKQMAESAAKLGKEGEAMGAQGAALGAQGAALGMQAAAAGMQAATAAMNSLAGSMAPGTGGKVALVDFRALKTLLPESVGDLKRVSATGEKEVAMGFGASHALGKYKGDGDARLSIKIVDTAGIGGIALAAFGLAAVEVDKETDDGYERTTTLGGNKAFEKYNSKSRNGEVKVLVGNRFIIEIDGDAIPMEAIKDAVSKVDLAKLQGLGK